MDWRALLAVFFIGWIIGSHVTDLINHKLAKVQLDLLKIYHIKNQ